MSRYLPPLQRKKKDFSIRQDTSSRIFPPDASSVPSDAIESTSAAAFAAPGFSAHAAASASGSAATFAVVPRDGRRNNKHPRNCGFVEDNVKTYSDPVCAVWTDLGVLTTKVMQDKWWKDNTINFPNHVPPVTKNTTVRQDYDDRNAWNNPRQTRHGANSDRRRALGVVPVNQLTKNDVYLEKVSFANQYDCRSSSNYPMRGRLHGAFVREPLSPTHRAHPDNLESKIANLKFHPEAENADVPLTPCSAVPREEEDEFDFNVVRQGRVDQPANEMSHVDSGIDVEKNHDFEMPEVTQEREPKDADFACFYETRAPTIEMEHYRRKETVLPILS